MTLKCNDCGATFDECDVAEWNENRGEFWGMPAYERMTGCPECHSTDIEPFHEEIEEGEEE